MRSFDSALREHLLPTIYLRPTDVDVALHELGSAVQRELATVPTAERAGLIDRFVRNLRQLSSHDRTRLERALLEALECQPRGVWASQLQTAVELVELRGHMKHAFTVLGLDWANLSRLQSLVGGVARWLQAAGGASMRVDSDTERVQFRIEALDVRLTPALVTESPMIQMLRAQLPAVDVRQTTDHVEIHFQVVRA